MRGMSAFAFVICAFAAAEQPGGGRVERLTLSGELVGRHLVPLLSRGQGLVLAAPSRGGEPLATTLWRWQDGATTRLAVIPGVRANRIQELQGGDQARRLLLAGAVPGPGGGEGELYGWLLVELPHDRAPLILWRSREVAGLQVGDEPFVAVDQGAQRWAVLVARSRAGRPVGGRLLSGELPKTVPTLDYEFLLESESATHLDADAPWFVVFVAPTRLLVVARGLPLILDTSPFGGVRRIPLRVPEPPVREALLHEASGTLWLTDDGRTHHGYVLAADTNGGPRAPLAPAWRLGPEELGFEHSRILGAVGEKLAILGGRNGRPVVVFARVDGRTRPTVEHAVGLPENAQPASVWFSPDGATLVWAQLGTHPGQAPVFFRAAVADLPSLR